MKYTFEQIKEQLTALFTGGKLSGSNLHTWLSRAMDVLRASVLIADTTNLIGDASLESIATINMSLGTKINISYKGYDYVYELIEFSGQKQIPFFITPADYDVSTNAKAWKIVNSVFQYKIELTETDIKSITEANYLYLLDTPPTGFVIQPLFVAVVNHNNNSAYYITKGLNLLLKYDGSTQELATISGSSITNTKFNIEQYGISNKLLEKESKLGILLSDTGKITVPSGTGNSIDIILTLTLLDTNASNPSK